MAKKDYKPHMMYCKDGTEHEAKTYQHGAMSTVQGTTCHQAIDRVQTVQWYISRIGGV